MPKRSFVAALLAFTLAIAALPVGAQDRSVFWDEWNVIIDNVDTEANRFDVSEFYNLSFTGSFSFGSRVIPTDRLNDIENVAVYQDERALTPTCNRSPGTVCVEERGGELSITYYFFAPISNDDETFRIEYTVEGALRVYEGGDQLSWYAIPPEHFGFGIGSSVVRVEMPDGFAPRPGVDPVVTYGAPTTVDVVGTMVTATATRQIRGDEALEIRVQYPHNPNAVAPDWQPAFDQQRQFDETVKPILTLVFLLLGLLIAIGGPLWVYTQYQRKGRDPRVGPVPEYLTEPPSELRPAVVGTLLDERADIRDVISTLIDLAHRGYVVIEESQNEGFLGIGRSSDFTFKRTDKEINELRPFERDLANRVFAGGMERTLDSLRNKFYTAIPKLQESLYDELVHEDLFATKPNTTRTTWGALGTLLLVIAGAGFFLGGPVAKNLSVAFFALPIGVGLTGIMTLIVAQSMPAKTRRGAEEAAKWRAFLEYLRNLEKYTAVENAVERFDQYLPYAVAFNLDRTWMAKFNRVDDMPVPTWYFPTYMGGPYGRGYTAGTPLGRGGGMFGGGGGGMGELAREGGGFSMETLSQNMSTSMENLSAGLSSMMNSAAAAMTSRPQSASSGSSGSWGGGGGSWSGGGGGGGGSSGGGSSGFG